MIGRYLELNIYIMKKKRFYVVTETVVNFKKRTVDTFVRDISKELDNAQSILASSKEALIRINGFEKSLISDFEWGWAYESECCTIKNEINIKFV